MNTNNTEEIDLLAIVKFFVRNKNTILFCAFIFFVSGIIIALLQKKIYVAESAILISGIRAEVMFEPKIQLKEIGSEVIQRFESKKQTVAEFLKSPTVLSEVIQEAENNNVVEKGKIKVKDLKNLVNTTITGEIVKVKVVSDKPQKAKFFADKIVEITVNKLSTLTSEAISKDDISLKLQQARQQYNKAVAEYNNFVKNNKIMELTKQINQLTQMYEYYTSNITSIEKNIWQAKNLKEQIESGGISSVGELADALALLKFKSSIFTGSSELPLKLEFTQQSIQRIDKSNIETVVKEIDSIISILEKRKKEFEKELETKKYEQQIQLLKTELEKEKVREKELVKNKDLAWDSLVTLERKLQEIEIGKDMEGKIFLKIAYLSELPETPESGKRKIIVVIATVLGLVVGMLVAGLKEMYLKVQKEIKL